MVRACATFRSGLRHSGPVSNIRGLQIDTFGECDPLGTGRLPKTARSWLLQQARVRDNRACARKNTLAGRRYAIAAVPAGVSSASARLPVRLWPTGAEAPNLRTIQHRRQVCDEAVIARARSRRRHGLREKGGGPKASLFEMARRLLLLVRAHQITMKATCAMPDTPSSRPWPEETVPVPAEHRDIGSSGGPCSVAALRMAGPMPARQHVSLAQLPFTGSVQHVSARESHQRVTQAKVSGPLADIDNKLNQFSDAGLSGEVTFEASTRFRHWLLPAAITFSRTRARVVDAASGAIAVERPPKRLDGLQLAQIDGVRVAKTSSQDVPIHPDGKRRLRAARASFHARHTSLCSVLRQPLPESSAPVFS